MNQAYSREAWKKMRKCHLTTYPECRMCSDTDDVVVHHLRYRGRRGESERPGDLVTLCRGHHDALHRSGSGLAHSLAFIREAP